MGICALGLNRNFQLGAYSLGLTQDSVTPPRLLVCGLVALESGHCLSTWLGWRWGLLLGFGILAMASSKKSIRDRQCVSALSTCQLRRVLCSAMHYVRRLTDKLYLTE